MVSVRRKWKRDIWMMACGHVGMLETRVGMLERLEDELKIFNSKGFFKELDCLLYFRWYLQLNVVYLPVSLVFSVKCRLCLYFRWYFLCGHHPVSFVCRLSYVFFFRWYFH